MRKTLLMSSAVLGLALTAPAFAQSGGTAGMGGTSGAGMPDNNPTSGMSHQGVNNQGSIDQGVNQPPVRRHGNRAMSQSGMTVEGTRPGHQPGVGDSEPMSARSSNIAGSDTRSQIAPRLPTPRVGEDAGAEGYVRDAQRALRQNRTGEAQEALERAETRVLEQHQGDQGRIPMMDTLEQARQALGRHDVAGARRILDQSVAENGGGGGYRGTGGAASGYNGTGPMGGAAMGSPSPMGNPGSMGSPGMGGAPMNPRMGPPGAMPPGGTAGPGTTR